MFNSISLHKYGPLLVFLPLIILIHATSLRYVSETYDEGKHLEYGQHILIGDSEREHIGYFGNSKMPISALNALPSYLSRLLPVSYDDKINFASLTAARLPTVVVSLLLAVLIFLWSKELYGPSAAWLSVFLYTFSPNILAHSQLVTTDLYAATSITWAVYCFSKYCERPTTRYLYLSAISFGISQISKYTALYLVPIFILIWIVTRKNKVSFNNKPDWRKTIRSAGIFLLLVWLVINSAFLWKGTFTPIRNYTFRSQLFEKGQSHLGPLSKLPFFLAQPYIEGIDWVYHDEQTKSASGWIYLLGELRKDRGFNGYFFIAQLFKEPLGVILLFFLSLLLAVKRANQSSFDNKEWTLLIPILFFSLYFNFFFNTQIGIRHILVTVPFIYIFMGSLIKSRPLNSAWGKFFFVGILISIVGSTLSYHRHYLSYFNELVWDRKKAYKILADSNLDWGQSEQYLTEYRLEHPDAIYEPDQPTTGTIIVSVNKLVGVFHDKYDSLSWLRNNYEPVDTIGYSYLVYRVE